MGNGQTLIKMEMDDTVQTYVLGACLVYHKAWWDYQRYPRDRDTDNSCPKSPHQGMSERGSGLYTI